jgi:hypothetical protein
MSTDTLIEPPAASESNPEQIKDGFVSPSPDAWALFSLKITFESCKRPIDGVGWKILAFDLP